MYCKDFEYDGKFLSSYGCVLASFSGASTSETVAIGSNLTLNTVVNPNNGVAKIISTQYDEVFSSVFQIAKVNCEDMNDYIFSEKEIASIMRWLNKKTYKKFKPIYEDTEFEDIYIMGTMNVQVIKNGDNVVGFECTLTANAPYGYYDGGTFEGTISSSSPFIIQDISDETGFIYPKVTITAKAAGDIILKNSLDNYTTTIKNVIAGEVITLSGDTKIITSSVSHDLLCNDFNYRFPKIINEDYNVRNVYSTTGVACTLKFEYAPICKAPIVA